MIQGEVTGRHRLPESPGRNAAERWVSLREQAELARIPRLGLRRRGGFLQIVVGGVEFPDEFVERKGSLPDVEEKAAARARTDNSALPAGCRIVTLVAGTAAIKFSGADLHLPPGKRSDFFDFLGFRFALQGVLEVADSLAKTLGDFGNLLPAEQQNSNSQDHQQLGHSNCFHSFLFKLNFAAPLLMATARMGSYLN